MNKQFLISLEGIQKKFYGVTVLDNVDFHLEKGVVHALVGGNGAGKSTLMKILTGVYTCDGGTIKINGEKVIIKNTKDAQEKGIRMIFQELSLSPTLSVMDNIFLAQELKKGLFLDKITMRKRTQELLDNLGIEAHPDDIIQDLDVGICQLIEIAKALLADSRILVMDEPTASLTDRETIILFKIIENLKNKGVSIVYISHRMKEIFQVADRIAVLRDGKIVVDKNKDEYTMKSLIDDMLGTKIEKTMEYIKRVIPVSDEVMLEVNNLTIAKRIQNISFNVKKGEVLGIAGLMGSGRTEVLETIAGIRPQGESNIILDGEGLNIRSVKNAINKGIVLIPEDRRRQGLVLMHSVKENICLPNFRRIIKGIIIDKKKVRKLCDESIGELNIKTSGIDTIISNLSGGNQQKVVIAKWLKTNPKLLLLDEPTAGVDVGAKGEIIDIIRKFVTKGNSVILVSSELSELIAVCDRILVFSACSIKGEHKRENIDSEEILQHAIQN